MPMTAMASSRGPFAGAVHSRLHGQLHGRCVRRRDSRLCTHGLHDEFGHIGELHEREVLRRRQLQIKSRIHPVAQPDQGERVERIGTERVIEIDVRRSHAEQFGHGLDQEPRHRV
jgi:hypothetical protein